MHQCIAEHPEIDTPGEKEIQFFNTRYDMGEGWYKRFFPYPDERVTGEWTPGYIHDPEGIERLKRLPETTRFLLAVRNPVDRAYSHFMMGEAATQKSNPAVAAQMFDRSIRDPDSIYAQYGFYARQAAPYLETFGASRIRLIDYHRITSNPESGFREIFEFLGVAPGFIPPSVTRRLNAAKRYRWPVLFRSLQRLTRTLEATPLRKAVIGLKAQGVSTRVVSKFVKQKQYGAMLPETRDYLSTLYRDDSTELSRMFGVELSWLQG